VSQLIRVLRYRPPRRLVHIASTIAIAALLLGLLLSGSARAGVYPAGAVTNGYAPYHYPSTHEQQRWENFCYCGTNGTTFDNLGDYVVSIQRELLYWGYSSGTIGVDPLPLTP
jgi:hypothetical protein